MSKLKSTKDLKLATCKNHPKWRTEILEGDLVDKCRRCGGVMRHYKRRPTTDKFLKK